MSPGTSSLSAKAKDLATALIFVRGVKAVVLGGSRARGLHRHDSDVDIGIYYDSKQTLDVSALNEVARSHDDLGRKKIVCAPGTWGQWLDGGGDLDSSGRRFELILRDWQRTEYLVRETLEGRIKLYHESGHPFGFPSTICAAEVAVAIPLADPSGDFHALQQQALYLSDAAARTISSSVFNESGLLLEAAARGIQKNDVLLIHGCSAKALTCLAFSLFAANRVHWLSEKDAVAVIDAFTYKPNRWSWRVQSVLSQIGQGEYEAGLRELAVLRRDTGRILTACGLLNL